MGLERQAADRREAAADGLGQTRLRILGQQRLGQDRPELRASTVSRADAEASLQPRIKVTDGQRALAGPGRYHASIVLSAGMLCKTDPFRDGAPRRTATYGPRGRSPRRVRTSPLTDAGAWSTAPLSGSRPGRRTCPHGH